MIRPVTAKQLKHILVETVRSNNSEFSTRLEAFGLTEKEARLYIYLLKYGAKSITELTKKLKSYRLDVYRTVESLTDKGLLEVSIKKPPVFAAVPLKVALDTIIQKHQIEQGQLESAQKELLNFAATAILDYDPGTEIAKFKVIRGVKKVITAAFTSCERGFTKLHRHQSTPHYASVRAIAFA